MPTIPGFPTIDDPAGERWLEEADTLAGCFSCEVHGYNPRAHRLNRFIILTAAHCLWKTTAGHPAWHRFDAGRWLERLGRTPEGPALLYEAGLTMHAFMCFLVKHGHIARSAELPCMEVLSRYGGIDYLHALLEQLGHEEGVSYSVTPWPFGVGVA